MHRLYLLCPPYMPCFATVGRSVGRYVRRSVCRPSVVRSISFDPFTWSTPNMVQGLPLMSRWYLLIFRSHVQRSRSNHSSKPRVLSGQYLLTPLLGQYQTWGRGSPNEYMISIDFQVTYSKVKVKPLFSAHCVVCSISLNPLLDQYHTWCRGCP